MTARSTEPLSILDLTYTYPAGANNLSRCIGTAASFLSPRSRSAFAEINNLSGVQVDYTFDQVSRSSSSTTITA